MKNSEKILNKEVDIDLIYKNGDIISTKTKEDFMGTNIITRRSYETSLYISKSMTSSLENDYIIEYSKRKARDAVKKAIIRDAFKLIMENGPGGTWMNMRVIVDQNVPEDFIVVHPKNLQIFLIFLGDSFLVNSSSRM